ncbi:MULTISPECIES: NAD(P)H-binding protein [unclassified Enterococcus]|uniref:NAD(P)-dependent oxidoreductase n=1 Tax=unclassified Enterococcus TaxID=2608891 RepID=UPI001557096A|nr:MULTISPECIES: NAD(P)H-binding protein [unclassified Enterococcus]MBS7577125.1 NAD(P)H-binding protein [Enterococcus sp. MMGLQ5-2]MBS7584428.1 NAD(P)H-binding protein [Enterococcus sp. MMGLQ5-1]NPD12283.1 NAD(P)H-binding protein [Enterococcus sp. MMGLQ5-1]NPD36959.1 NAD(P)H-binding protein [Enterococcus sp. MMGLQ5-2]
MKIGVIGATGNAGLAVLKEAIARNHEVTAIVRNQAKLQGELGEQKVQIIEKEVFDLTIDDLKQFDVVVNAFATMPPKAYLHIDLAAKLVHLFRENKKTRLFFIVGAGSLKTGSDNHLLLDDLKLTPDSESWIAIPDNQYKELEFLRMIDNVDWVAVSPGVTFQHGSAGSFISGENHLLFNQKNESITSSGTLAVAILNEIETPKYHQGRFTVIDD